MDAAYCRLVPANQRTLPAPNLGAVDSADTYTKLLAAWDTYIRRIENGEAHFPSELEEAWIEAMDDPFRTDCKRERAQRVGLYGAIRHIEGEVGDHCCFGQLTQAFGALTQRMGAVLADGRMHAGDAQRLPELIRQAKDLQADLQSLINRAEASAGDGQEPPVRSVS